MYIFAIYSNIRFIFILNFFEYLCTPRTRARTEVQTISEYLKFVWFSIVTNLLVFMRCINCILSLLLLLLMHCFAYLAQQPRMSKSTSQFSFRIMFRIKSNKTKRHYRIYVLSLMPHMYMRLRCIFEATSVRLLNISSRVGIFCVSLSLPLSATARKFGGFRQWFYAAGFEFDPQKSSAHQKRSHRIAFFIRLSSFWLWMFISSVYPFVIPQYKVWQFVIEK